MFQQSGMQLHATILSLSKSCRWNGLSTRLMNIDHATKSWVVSMDDNKFLSYWFSNKLRWLGRSEKEARILHSTDSWKKALFGVNLPLHIVQQNHQLCKIWQCFTWHNMASVLPLCFLCLSTCPVFVVVTKYLFGVSLCSWECVPHHSTHGPCQVSQVGSRWCLNSVIAAVRTANVVHSSQL